jgi:hypothetical protein
MHLEATDQSADSADDSTGYYADRCESLNQRLGSYFRKERPHAEKSCGFACKWPVQESAHTTSVANNREMLVTDEEQVVTDPHEERDEHLICLLRAILDRANSAGRSGVQLLASSL